MAYNAIAQADLEVASNATDSDTSRSPSPKASPQHHGFEQLPLDVDNLGGNDSKFEPARAADDISVGNLISKIRSMGSTSYDMVEEDDDYEVIEPKSHSPCRGPPPIDTTTAIKKTVDNKQPRSASSVSPPEEPALRTPISDHTVPLSHPTPGLQSLQGAYLGNIERLERSAERMSTGSADIASEIRKMDLELKRRCSSSSVANSVVASNNNPHTSHGASPTSNHPSPRNSIRSATRLPSSRLARVAEGAPAVSQPPPQYNCNQRFYSARGVNTEIERPSSSATNDTYQQAKVLFSDFDGVHYVPQDSVQGRERQASLTKPPLAKHSKSYRADNMVYYPAPVPTALNLPPRLADKPPQAQEKRRSHRLSTALLGHTRSALGLSGRPATSREIEVSQTSPVATLNRILDDSTHAPVTTSSGRPCTSAGAYGNSHHEISSQGLTKQKKKRSSRSLFRFYKKTSSSDLGADPAAAGHSSQPTEAEAADTHEDTALKSDIADEQEAESEALDHSQEDIRDYTGPPDTLMAELELRKHELKHRTRTAADPQGLRSTLLQLDAVAQKQSERRQRPVTMAWDYPNAVNDSEGDEDVPLGVLYPEKPDIPVETRPLDLIEQRQTEENEPLSKRRARLRGEQPADKPPNLSGRPSTMYLPDSHGLADSDSEDEGETLAQRIKRLRAKNRNSTAGCSDFTNEVLAEINHIKGNDGKEGETASQDETLAETRARLRQDSKPQISRYAKIPRTRRSMGSMSLMRPDTAGRQSSHETALGHAPMPSQHAYYDPRKSMHPVPVGYHQPQYARYPVAANSYGYGMGRPNTIYSDAALGMNHTGYAMPGYSRSGVGQRERINDWRQSVI